MLWALDDRILEGGGVGEALRILFTSNTKEKYKIKREWVLWKYMYLKDTLVISICKINAGEMLHLRTASFQCPAMLLQFVKHKFGWSD